MNRAVITPSNPTSCTDSDLNHSIIRVSKVNPMGSKWFTGGVAAAPRGRIQFDFRLDGVRYRPTIKRPPSETNLRRARERLEARHASPASIDARPRPGKIGAWNCARGRYTF